MLNYIWFFLIIIGFVVSFFTGTTDAVSNSIMDSSKDAINLCIGIAGAMCFWSGIMRIAQKAGITDAIGKFAEPVVRKLFPEIKDNKKASGAVVMNLTANFLGMGNAATPFGLKAMKELDELNGKSKRASNTMCMLIVLNTSMIQLLPSTLLALRSASGSANPQEVMGPIWIASLATTIAGIAFAKFFQKTEKIKDSKN